MSRGAAARGALGVIVALTACTAVTACKGGEVRAHHTGSAANVELVPVIADAGASGSAGAAAPGATTDEVEPNDGADTATLLPVGGTVRGRIGSDDDVDSYRIDVGSAGVLSVMLSGVDGVDLTLEIVDGNGATLARSDRGGARVVEGAPNLGVTPGRYTAIVRAKRPPPPPPAKKPKHAARGATGAKADAEPAPPVTPATTPPTTPAPVYELSARLAPPAAGLEREPDDDRGTANDLVIGEPGTGYIGWTADVDEWKLSLEALSAKDVVDVEVGAVDGVALSIEVTDAVGAPLLVRRGVRGRPVQIRDLALAVGSGAPPFAYLVVRGDHSNPDTPYAVKVTARLLEADRETEPDDALDHPFAIAADRKVVHGSLTPGDVDCYLVPHAGDAEVDVTIEPRGDLDLSAELFDVAGAGSAAGSAGGKPVAKSDQRAGAAERVHGKVAAGDAAVVRVTAKGTAGDYDLVIHDSDDGDR